MTKKKPAWPVESYRGTCAHVELVATIGPRTKIPIDVGVDRDEVIIGFRDETRAYPMTRREVRELVNALNDAHARTVTSGRKGA